MQLELCSKRMVCLALKKHHNFVGLITTVLVIVIIGGILFYVYSLSQNEAPDPLTQPTKQTDIFNGIKDIFFSNFNVK